MKIETFLLRAAEPVIWCHPMDRDEAEKIQFACSGAREVPIREDQYVEEGRIFGVDMRQIRAVYPTKIVSPYHL